MEKNRKFEQAWYRVSNMGFGYNAQNSLFYNYTEEMLNFLIKSTKPQIAERLREIEEKRYQPAPVIE